MLIQPTTSNTDFVVGEDSFDDLEIADAGDGAFFYFKNTKKGLVKRFVLQKTPQTQRNCVVTLIKRKDDVFEPRFDLEILDRTKRAVAQLEIPVSDGETRSVKAKVNLSDCHKQFSMLLKFVAEFDGVELDGPKYAVVASADKEKLALLLGAVGKDAAISEFATKYSGKISEKDLNILAGRKKSLEVFKSLLEDPAYFEGRKKHFGLTRDEDLWQRFFEANPWIFGYGLQLVACEGLDDRKLETIVVGSDIFDGGGKRADALLKTRSLISKTLFSEIKTHKTPLIKDYPRTGVFVPGDDLQGAIGQIQKTIHKVSLKINQNFRKMTDLEGNPTGEDLAFVRPRGVVIVGQLEQLFTEKGLNEEKYASFELFRQQLTGVEILTFDELYERTRFIIEE